MGTRGRAKLTFGSSFDQQLVWTPQSGSHLDLGHPTFLDVGHAGNNYINFPRIDNLLNNTSDTRSGGIFAARPQRGARRKDRHRIRDFLRFPKERVRLSDHQLGSRGLETEGSSPPSGGRPAPQERPHSMNKIKTYSSKYNTITTLKEGMKSVPAKDEVVEDGVEGRVESVYKPFEDSKGRVEDILKPFEDSEGMVEDAIVSLKEN
ncbi:hypothetical protein Cgig2_024222 [Carnegiea gigantea]|uniref:Uncharacterized protein n=1 Tax=Carnegiea gigantea TaxID=171969 RepID=A0A9Q1JLY6_9CARY|nr:hypothetical protein Cgig2_024222 [Carnegiea gigantea]